MLDFNIISTGSKGNAVVLNKEILVDCGVSFKALKPYYKELRLALLTHIHGDHFKTATVRKIAELRPGLRFACGIWMVVPLLKAGVAKSQIDVLASGTEYLYACGSVEPFEVYHDVRNFGYKIDIPKRGEGLAAHKVFYVTDAANLDGIKAENYDLYMIEGDYAEDEIEERISEKKATGEFIYERRAMQFHLSKEQCRDFVAQNAGPDSMFIYMHGHKEEAE